MPHAEPTLNKLTVHQESQPILPRSVYCAAPWTLVYLRPDGFFSVCCRAKRTGLSISAKSVDEYWNGEEMRSLRVAMMNHSPPADICYNCINNISTVKPARLGYNERARADMAEILASTQPDGTTSFRPNSLDIRTNLCNLKCRMCSAGSSSAIYSENIQNDVPVPALGPNAREEHKLSFGDDDLRRVKHLIWAGGEPFMSATHWSIMESLVRLGNVDLSIWYNSNFTFPGNTYARAEQLLPKFSGVKIGASIDAIGEDFDYLRDGASFEAVVGNILALRRAAPNLSISFDCTVTSLGLVGLEKLVRFCIANRILMTCKTVVIPSTDWLSINALKPEIVEACLTEAVGACRGTPLQAAVTSFASHVRHNYHLSVPDFAACRSRERIRGREGYLEARIGESLNRADCSDPASAAQEA